MANFNLDDYETVESRIKRFYSDHPDGAIHADLISDPSDLKVVVVKAYVYVGDRLVGTGLAFEKAGEGYVNKTSHLENCETSAIGRALANFNYSGDKRPSREEMQKASQPREVARGATQADQLVSKLDQALENGLDRGVYDTWMGNIKRAGGDKTLLATMAENVERILYQSKVPAETPVSEPELPESDDDPGFF
jgi:hypothetical protein